MEIILWIVIGGLVGILCGKLRGRETEGMIWGMFLGIFGWLIILVGPDKRRKCYQCRGVVMEGAVRCCHCGSPLVRQPKPVTIPAGAGASVKIDPTIYVLVSGESYGPFTYRCIADQVKAGELPGDVLCATEGTDWVKFSDWKNA